jgi:uncharacterized protein YjiS (DUF1127 family)
MHQHTFRGTQVADRDDQSQAAEIAASSAAGGFAPHFRDFALLYRELRTSARRWRLYRSIACELRRKNETELHQFRLDREEIELTAYALAHRLEGNDRCGFY